MAGPAGSHLGNETPVAPRPRGTHPSVREIHKNAWLKRHAPVDKKGTHFSKKGEKFWVVFCVHDDSEAFLEFYTEPKMGAIHKPLSAVSLKSCLHVSPSIIAGEGNEYQFAVTLQTEVIRLVAANWDQMIEWVESLQGKLREMNVLSPKDNLYSKLPETTGPKGIAGLVASTRDPNSPLPPPPPGTIATAGQMSRAQNTSIIGGGGRTEQVNRRSGGEPSSSVTNSRDLTGAINTANSATSRVSVNGNSGSSSTAFPSSSANGHHHERNHNDSSRTRGQASSSGETNGVQDNTVAVGGGQQPVSKRKQNISVKVSVDVKNNGHSRSQRHSHHHQQNTPLSATTVVVIGRDASHHGSRMGEVTATTTTVSSSSSTHVINGSNSNGHSTNETVANSANPTVVIHQGSHHHSQNGPENNCVSRVSVNGTKIARPKCSKVQQQQRRNNVASSDNNGESNGDQLLVNIESTPTGNARTSNNGSVVAEVKNRTDKIKNASATKKSSSSENIYEHIYIPDGRPVVVERASSNGVKCNNGNNHQQQQQQQHVKARSQQNNGMIQRSSSDRSPEEENPSGSSRESHARRMIKGNSSQRSSSLGRIELPPPSSSRTSETTHHCPQDHHHRDRGQGQDQDPSRTRNNGNRNNGRQQPQQQGTDGVMVPRSIGNSTFFATPTPTTNGTSTHHQHPSSSVQLYGTPLDALIGSRNGEYRLRRDDYLIRMGETNNSGGSSSGSDNDNHSNNASSSNDHGQNNGGGHLPLKEQQVIHLQMEINHPGGVRVILRKKDCLNSIAFVDYLGAVWIAGWKQTQFPVLYYGFHVGDQILKVAGVNVQSSVEASRAIKMISSMQVEFIIRRLPYGKVYALKRSRDGEPLGLVAEGGSGEISEVLPDGLAARYGLPPKGLSVDGQTPCNWYLTEVNNRPLSLMSKENEVKDRLNAVGKEISILVQPADLVKHLRKSLKSYKGFKDYVVG